MQFVFQFSPPFALSADMPLQLHRFGVHCLEFLFHIVLNRRRLVQSVVKSTDLGIGCCTAAFELVDSRLKRRHLALHLHET